MRRALGLVLLSVAQCCHGAPAHGPSAALHARSDDGVPVKGKTIWMFWSQGNLRNETRGKYANCMICVEQWRKLNPKWKVELLDDKRAYELSPSYRRYSRLDNLGDAVLSDILRLDLLSRYGGVWSDVSVCPQRPLSTFIGRKLEPSGFWTYWLDHEVVPADANCEFEDAASANSRLTVTWFLAVSHPHHPVVETWRDALEASLDSMLENSRPYGYFLVHCVLNLVSVANETVHDALQAMPHEFPDGDLPWMDESFAKTVPHGRLMDKFHEDGCCLQPSLGSVLGNSTVRCEADNVANTADAEAAAAAFDAAKQDTTADAAAAAAATTEPDAGTIDIDEAATQAKPAPLERSTATTTPDNRGAECWDACGESAGRCFNEEHGRGFCGKAGEWSGSCCKLGAEGHEADPRCSGRGCRGFHCCVEDTESEQPATTRTRTKDDAGPPPKTGDGQCSSWCATKLADDTGSEARACSWNTCSACPECDAPSRSAAAKTKNEAAAGGPCTAHHGADEPCCGQSSFDTRAIKDVVPCPEAAPFCLNYIYKKRFGVCAEHAPPASPPAAPEPEPEPEPIFDTDADGISADRLRNAGAGEDCYEKCGGHGGFCERCGRAPAACCHGSGELADDPVECHGVTHDGRAWNGSAYVATHGCVLVPAGGRGQVVRTDDEERELADALPIRQARRGSVR